METELNDLQRDALSLLGRHTWVLPKRFDRAKQPFDALERRGLAEKRYGRFGTEYRALEAPAT